MRKHVRFDKEAFRRDARRAPFLTDLNLLLYLASFDEFEDFVFLRMFYILQYGRRVNLGLSVSILEFMSSIRVLSIGQIKIRKITEVLNNVEQTQKQFSASFRLLRNRRKKMFLINETLTAAVQNVFKAVRSHSSAMLPLMQASLNASDVKYHLALRVEEQLGSELLRIKETLAKTP